MKSSTSLLLSHPLSSFSPAVIKMEGGTDLDLQVLEVPTAPAGAGVEASSGGGAGGGGGAGEKSQGGPSGGNVGAQSGSESTASRTEETAGGETGEIKDSDKVRRISSVFCSSPGFSVFGL